MLPMQVFQSMCISLNNKVAVKLLDLDNLPIEMVWAMGVNIVEAICSNSAPMLWVSEGQL